MAMMNLNKNEIAFILDAIDEFDWDGDYLSENKRFELSKSEIRDLYDGLEDKLK